MSAALGALSQAQDLASKGRRKAESDKELVSNPNWPRPVIVPVPDTTAGVEKLVHIASSV